VITLLIFGPLWVKGPFHERLITNFVGTETQNHFRVLEGFLKNPFLADMRRYCEGGKPSWGILYWGYLGTPQGFLPQVFPIYYRLFVGVHQVLLKVLLRVHNLWPRMCIFLTPRKGVIWGPNIWGV